MIIKIYQLHLFKIFSKKLINITSVFFILILIINLFEEVNYLKGTNANFSYPLLLSFLNTPSVIYEIFPFIFLISTQFFFMSLEDTKELILLKHYKLTNLKIIKTLITTSFIWAILIVLIFYNISSKLKYNYLDIKNMFANDNKFLAVVTENGIWIKDEIDNTINMINADKIDNNRLINVSITQFDNKFNFLKNIQSKSSDLSNKNWSLKDSTITIDGKPSELKEFLIFKSNFDMEKINSLFSNLSSLTFFELHKLKTDYRSIGYSTMEIEVHLNKIYSFVFYLMIMTIISSIIMLNIKYQKKMIPHIIFGIFCSVIIYYINYFSNLLGLNAKLPLIFSIWLPLLILSFISLIGLVRINEK
jgi:lipopolysaccharide export system permease protein